jgi:hypothetical protein
MRALAVLAVCAGCGVREAAPRLDAVMPGYACNLGAAELELDGASFTPLPTTTLGAATLVLPRVWAQAGATRADADVVWRSETRLDITLPVDGAAPGAWDVAIENPDGQRTIGLGALAMVATPRVTQVTPPEVCVTGSMVALDGSAFASGASVLLTGSGMALPALSVMVTSATHANVQFGANTLVRGQQYDLTFANPDGCATTVPDAVQIRQAGGGCP